MPKTHSVSSSISKLPLSTNPHLAVPRRGAISPDELSLISVDDFSELRLARSREDAGAWQPEDEEKLVQAKGWRGQVWKSWYRNKGLVMVLLAQIFGTLMNVTTRLLEAGDEEAGVEGMHPFQIIFARMSVTAVVSYVYMWYTKTPHSPLGLPEVRWLLLARGVGGFFGVAGMYYSLQALALSDATVLTFLAPFISCWLCSKIVHEPFTRVEQFGGLVSLLGVVLIAHPSSLFSRGADAVAAPAGGDISERAAHDGAPKATPDERLFAVAMAMVGVCGASVAYTTIRWIGRRAHSLISVTYFSTWGTIISFLGLLFIPSIPFVLPRTLQQWGLLFFIGITGFIMQFLLTAGLRYEKSSRATNMVYSQMLFALLFDKLIWGVTPDMMSVFGSSLILGSAIVVAVQKESSKNADASSGTASNRDEESGLMRSSSVDGSDALDDEEEEQRGRTRTRPGEREPMAQLHAMSQPLPARNV